MSNLFNSCCTEVLPLSNLADSCQSDLGFKVWTKLQCLSPDPYLKIGFCLSALVAHVGLNVSF